MPLCPLFYLLSCLSLISIPFSHPIYHSNPQAPQCWQQTAAPSVNKCRCMCVSILYPVKERECVCLRNICWVQWKTLMCVGEGVINKYHKWLLCVPIFPRRCVENGASVRFYRADIETSWGPQIRWDFYEDSQTSFMCHRSLKFTMYVSAFGNAFPFISIAVAWLKYVVIWLEIRAVNIMWLITLDMTSWQHWLDKGKIRLLDFSSGQPSRIWTFGNVLTFVTTTLPSFKACNHTFTL